MCGFVGVINFNNNTLEESILREMTDSISHRGPDDDGYFQNIDVSFGFRRLSIIDIDNGHQPMKSDDKRYVLIFNGEIYNFKEIRKQLENFGYKFHTKSDTEVLLNAYKHWRDKCVDYLNGMFAFAIYDKKNKNVYIARDRLGIKPLYYAKVGSVFIFASEIKALLKFPGINKSADYKALSSYLTFRYTYGNQSYFQNIKKLLPGHFVNINPTEENFIKYWTTPFYNKKIDHGEKYYIEKIDELLSAAVSKRLASDVPLGALLSGGLDSSIIVALMAKDDNKINSYSIGFNHEGYDESKYAKLVADHCSTEHLHLNLSKENYIDNLSSMIKIKDAPLSIPHEQALYQICKELKNYTTVIISGEGADELFGGYGRVQRSPFDYKKIDLIKNYLPNKTHSVFAKIMGLSKSDLKFNSNIDHFFSVYNWMPFEEKWNIFSDNMLESINYDDELINFWKQDFMHTDSGNVYDQVLYMFQKNHLICLLDRLDTMSMASGVEARVPFVDHELVEFVSSIPIKYKLKWRSPVHKFQSLFINSSIISENKDISKYLLREYGKRMLPKIITKRKKKGFPVPLDEW